MNSLEVSYWYNGKVEKRKLLQFSLNLQTRDLLKLMRTAMTPISTDFAIMTAMMRIKGSCSIRCSKTASSKALMSRNCNIVWQAQPRILQTSMLSE